MAAVVRPDPTPAPLVDADELATVWPEHAGQAGQDDHVLLSSSKDGGQKRPPGWKCSASHARASLRDRDTKTTDRVLAGTTVQHCRAVSNSTWLAR